MRDAAWRVSALETEHKLNNCQTHFTQQQTQQGSRRRPHNHGKRRPCGWVNATANATGKGQFGCALWGISIRGGLPWGKGDGHAQGVQYVSNGFPFGHAVSAGSSLDGVQQDAVVAVFRRFFCRYLQVGGGVRFVFEVVGGVKGGGEVQPPPRWRECPSS